MIIIILEKLTVGKPLLTKYVVNCLLLTVN